MENTTPTNPMANKEAVRLNRVNQIVRSLLKEEPTSWELDLAKQFPKASREDLLRKIADVQTIEPLGSKIARGLSFDAASQPPE